MTMKVQTEQQQVIGLTKVAKGRASREERDINQGGAIQGLLDKLKDLVPNMPRSKKLTKLEIIQNVIDYILDLEIALEAHPTKLSSSSSPAVTTRQPLGVLPPANNSTTNALSEDEVTQKVIRHFAALDPAVASTNALSSLDL
uniref:DNA-binding protein inhibitor n=1 Tax=Rhipicephalus zambeziensis TaxID=60191 RepID=A0A224YVX2_9ACAR